MGRRTRTGCAEFSRRLGCGPFFHSRDATGFGHDADGLISDRNADVLVLERVKLDSRPAQKLLDKDAAVDVTDGETVGLGDFEYMIGGNEAPRAGHVFHDHGRIPRQMFVDVPRDRSAVDIEAAAGAEADHYTHGLVFIERLLPPATVAGGPLPRPTISKTVRSFMVLLPPSDYRRAAKAATKKSKRSPATSPPWADWCRNVIQAIAEASRLRMWQETRDSSPAAQNDIRVIFALRHSLSRGRRRGITHLRCK